MRDGVSHNFPPRLSSDWLSSVGASVTYGTMGDAPLMRLTVYNGVTPLSRNNPHSTHKTITKERSTTMAKKYPFTRSISKQNVIALAFNKETAEPFNTSVTIAPPIADTKKLEKAVAAKVDSDTVKFIEIVDITVDEKVYGITLDDFMAHAVELDPKTRSAIAANTPNA